MKGIDRLGFLKHHSRLTEYFTQMPIWLAMKTADGGERSFPIVKPRTVIGREMLCDLRVAIPSVAPQHCEITLVDDHHLEVRDLESETGTYRNGNRVDQAILDVGDRLTVGTATFIMRRLEATIVGKDSPADTSQIPKIKARQVDSDK